MIKEFLKNKYNIFLTQKFYFWLVIITLSVNSVMLIAHFVISSRNNALYDYYCEQMYNKYMDNIYGFINNTTVECFIEDSKEYDDFKQKESYIDETIYQDLQILDNMVYPKPNRTPSLYGACYQLLDAFDDCYRLARGEETLYNYYNPLIEQIYPTVDEVLESAKEVNNQIHERLLDNKDKGWSYYKNLNDVAEAFNVRDRLTHLIGG